MVYEGHIDYIPDEGYKVKDEQEQYEKIPIKVFLSTSYSEFSIRGTLIQILESMSDEIFCITLGMEPELVITSIQSNIQELIRDSEVVIADLTDLNPNVMFELGYAQGLQKEILLLTQETTTIPFNLAGNLFIVYDPSNIDKLNLLMNNWFHSYFATRRKRVGVDNDQ